MAHPPEPTIFALASAPGRAGVAVVRVSGEGASRVIDYMAGPRPDPRRAVGRFIRHPESGEKIDRGVVLWFPKPASFTGEDVVELHLHGGRAVVQAVLSALTLMPGLRMAEPGEFARRAFEAGKIDLAEVEGLADLIDAETEGQRRQALAQASGVLSDLYDGWRASLVEALGLIEAGIDFADEGDIGLKTFTDARSIIQVLVCAVTHHLEDGHRGEILREGFRVALVGPPNAGKSSLLNALARRDVAIVSAEAGTTRDVVEARLDLGGLPVIVSDTAGFRETEGAIEREGMRRSQATAEAADLVLWLTDATEPQTVLPAELAPLADRTLLVMNKTDLLPGGDAPVLPDDIVPLSVETGAGLGDLIKRLTVIASERIGHHGEPALTQVRHRRLVEACRDGLEAFLSGPTDEVELRAEDLRGAADALGRITGRVDVEDVLDHIFGRFCIGK
ncbi:tRNA uridine-5-carboxymethylaminomethyl(34) synthesis GTPase MnmE [Hyphomicrobium sp. LHD-15]|uniref:tRNA uridine-5-carboxymethylaminomethyl(34) synthesis GTPase MnmE n=1 Tax=Hyphomicrobium sp. LHD-15 TaxID=3072142 RepID=UPI00280CF20F|nr:tRNA uridine-5-carboxymethylaminomethyl(34) synthesis GTPase MnmE [Hyphomicrobium sp. LHD-15]MDQ8698592.1 tRNA uridine-5-carboxymethylaminomethyl(34) synthesis GTPase MnmE [Hyphomicrobium sp. LHD-15]